MPESGITEILKKGLLSLGLAPSDDRIRSFSLYLSELKKWNKACNLTGIRNDKDVVIKHFLDSLLYLDPVPQGIARIADIGSGAGFPGIPIKIVRPEIEMYLIEPSVKKVAFLKQIARLLQLEHIQIVGKRVEEVNVPFDVSAPVDIIVTRALFSIGEFVRKTAHIVKRGGFFILSKGPKVREELKKTGDMEYEVRAIPLPQTGITRYIIVLKAKSGVSGYSFPEKCN